VPLAGFPRTDKFQCRKASEVVERNIRLYWMYGNVYDKSPDSGSDVFEKANVGRDFNVCLHIQCAIKISYCWIEPRLASPRCISEPIRLAENHDGGTRETVCGERVRNVGCKTTP
jgi:hypothetical protein